MRVEGVSVENDLVLSLPWRCTCPPLFVPTTTQSDTQREGERATPNNQYEPISYIDSIMVVR